MEGKINQANGRLKTANVRVRIKARGNKLYLQATLPPKPGSDKVKAYQQEIALGVSASPAGVSLAEKEARKVSALLDCKQFDWTPYLSPQQKPPETVGEWLQRFELEFRPTVSEITWDTDYREVFIKLDESKLLTVDLCVRQISRTEPNSRSRKRYCNALGKLAKFAGLEADFGLLRGNYSSKSVDPRSLPTDEAIAEHFFKIGNPQWRYVYGLMATFGLRPHECFNLDVTDLLTGGETVTVLKGKTGRRQVWAYYPEWIELFSLRSGQLPPVSGKRNSDYGDRTTQYFKRDAKLPFKPYDLRHAWAVRTIVFGLPDSLSAQQMGHSLTVHNETYQAWITAKTHQEMHERLKTRVDRPIAPIPVSA